MRRFLKEWAYCLWIISGLLAVPVLWWYWSWKQAVAMAIVVFLLDALKENKNKILKFIEREFPAPDRSQA